MIIFFSLHITERLNFCRRYILLSIYKMNFYFIYFVEICLNLNRMLYISKIKNTKFTYKLYKIINYYCSKSLPIKPRNNKYGFIL